MRTAEAVAVIGRLSKLCQEFADQAQALCGPRDIGEPQFSRELEQLVAAYAAAMNAAAATYRAQQERQDYNSREGATRSFA